jgi:SEC-C motif-containing protein
MRGLVLASGRVTGLVDELMSQTSPARAPLTSNAPCPCGSGLTFGECCEPIIKQRKVAATAEQLMRSRFTAHVIQDEEHLHRTYLPTARQPYVPEESGGEAMNWTRLVIHSHEPEVKPNTSYVDFSAYYSQGDQELALHEKSEFLRVDGAWLFSRPLRQGPAPIKSAVKVGRNDPCPCGSGKKYKQCCLAKA